MSNITLIFEKGTNNACCNFVPMMDIEAPALDSFLPKDFQRKELNLPNIPEVDIVRHYVGLSRKNYGVDNGIYPLGSCTMKYNPKINELTSRLPGFALSHPLQERNFGSIEVLAGLGSSLCEITGMDAFTMEPAAGAHGEFTGLLLMKKFFENKGNKKSKIIIPDSSHGTNPASATMAGFSIIEIQSNSRGEIPLDQLEFAMKVGDVAGLMLTNPNTLGLFDSQIKQITEIVHKYGGLCYYDGANMNPMLGVCRPGDMGFDIIHLNLHKSFATPHGGGGPGSGPVGVKKDIIPFLPISCYVTRNKKLICPGDSTTSIGRLRSFWGNFGVIVRAYTYILALGGVGLRRAGQCSVLNANYLRVLLKQKYPLPYDRICQHEFVLSEEGLPNEITAEDVAKRVLDYGLYAPTIYFPLIVHGAIMIEPTETESKASLDEFVNILMKIYQEAQSQPELLKSAPHNTPVSRLDATLAARKPILRE
jgi:glycine dehydrogenase subunit 2